MRFLYNFKVLRIKTQMSNGVEWAPFLVARDVSGPPTEQADALPFDLIVICAGVKSRDLTWFTYPAPLLSFGGYALDIPASHSVVARLREKIPSLVGNASPDGWLQVCRATRPRAAGDVASGATPPGDDVVRVAGLASLDESPLEPFSVESAARIIGRRLRLHHGIDRFAEECLATSAHLEQRDASSSVVTASRYSRAVTPDGLPIVSRLGMMKNVFMCTGFGDRSAMLAPGAARLVSHLVVARSAEDELTPYTLGRFKGWHYMHPTAFMAGWSITGTLIKGEHFLCNLGQRCSDEFQEHVMNTNVMRWLTIKADERE